MAGGALEECACNQQADMPYFLVLISTDSDSIRISPSFSACQAKDTLVPWKESLDVWRGSLVVYIVNHSCSEIFLSMFVGIAMLWSKFPHNLCLLCQVEIVSTWAGNAQTNTPKLRMASTSHLFLVLLLALVFKPTKMEREVSCLFCVCEAMTALVTSYYWRQLIVKLTAQPYFVEVSTG